MKPFSMIREFHLADWFTLGNAVCGVGALFSTMTFLASNDVVHIYYAAALVFAALVFDVLDGRIARWRNKSSALGRELDSLADIISFGVAPAIIGYGCGMRGLYDRVLLAYFVACGVSRLARYNVTAEEISQGTGKVTYFRGDTDTHLDRVGYSVGHRSAARRSWRTTVVRFPARRRLYVAPFEPAVWGLRLTHDQPDPYSQALVEAALQTMQLHIDTPLVESRARSLHSGRSVWLKLDALQPPGSFKIRGVGHACTEYARRGARRFVSSSGGNAGLAVVKTYAMRRGITLISRTRLITVAQSMGLSFAKCGMSSAMNSSECNSRISSCKVRPLPFKRSGTRTRRALAKRSREDSVGQAFSFSILDT